MTIEEEKQLQQIRRERGRKPEYDYEEKVKLTAQEARTNKELFKIEFGLFGLRFCLIHVYILK